MDAEKTRLQLNFSTLKGNFFSLLLSRCTSASATIFSHFFFPHSHNVKIRQKPKKKNQ
jgi:hypothetical protein